MDLLAEWTVEPHRGWGGWGQLVATGNVLLLSLGGDMNTCFVVIY